MTDFKVEELGAVTPALMTDPKVILAFMFAGDATITVRGKEKRYTYRIKKGNLRPEDESRGYTQPPYWVSYLCGQDNENDYLPLGMIQFGLGGKTPKFKVTRNVKSATRDGLGNPKPMEEQAAHIKGFNMVFEGLLRNRIFSTVEIWHEGTCARCGRKLTDDDSISRGFGPTCFELAGGVEGIQNFFVSLAPIAELSSKKTVVYAAKSTTPATVKTVRPTPAQLLAEVDAMVGVAPAIVKLTPLASKPQPVYPVNAGDAEILAQSQGWSVAEATAALSKRKTVNQNPKKAVAESKAEEALKRTTTTVEADELLENDWELAEVSNDPSIIALVDTFKASDPSGYTMDGIMCEEEAFSFWYRRFESNSTFPS